MIKYDRFWVTMKERGITQYDLYEHYQITRSLLDRLRKNKNVEIYTIDRLCSILHCEIEDIVEHIPEPDEMNETNRNIRRKTLLPLKIRKTLSDCKRNAAFRRLCHPCQKEFFMLLSLFYFPARFFS